MMLLYRACSMPKLGADDGECVGAEVGAVTVERTLPFQSEECLIMHHETPDARLEVFQIARSGQGRRGVGITPRLLGESDGWEGPLSVNSVLDSVTAQKKKNKEHSFPLFRFFFCSLCSLGFLSCGLGPHRRPQLKASCVLRWGTRTSIYLFELLYYASIGVRVMFSPPPILMFPPFY